MLLNKIVYLYILCLCCFSSCKKETETVIDYEQGKAFFIGKWKAKLYDANNINSTRPTATGSLDIQENLYVYNGDDGKFVSNKWYYQYKPEQLLLGFYISYSSTSSISGQVMTIVEKSSSKIVLDYVQLYNGGGSHIASRFVLER